MLERSWGLSDRTLREGIKGLGDYPARQKYTHKRIYTLSRRSKGHKSIELLAAEEMAYRCRREQREIR